MPTDTDGGGHSLVVPFLDQRPEYALGVEFGMIFHHLATFRPRVFRDYVCTANQSQIKVAAMRLGYTVEKMDVCKKAPEWTLLVLRRRD